MSKKFMIILTVLFLIPAMGFSAQQGGYYGKWWQMPRVAQKLELTEAEIERLEHAYIAGRRNLIRLKADVEAEQFDLETRIEAKKLDEEGALNQYRTLEQAKAKLGMERFRLLLEIRKILGYERFRDLMRMQKMRKEAARRSKKNNQKNK